MQIYALLISTMDFLSMELYGKFNSYWYTNKQQLRLYYKHIVFENYAAAPTHFRRLVLCPVTSERVNNKIHVTLCSDRLFTSVLAWIT